MSEGNGNGKVKGLTAAELFNVPRRAPVPVAVPGMGTVYVRSIKARERDRFEIVAGRERERARKDRGGERPVKVRALLVALCACDEDGKPLFSEDDAEQLSEQPADVIDLIFDAAAKLNRMGATDEDDAEKNSEPARR